MVETAEESDGSEEVAENTQPLHKVARKKMKPEYVTYGALVLAVLGGGGGTALNVRSNNAVLDKLDGLTLKMVEVQGTLKANDADKARLEAMIREARDGLERLRAELSDAKSEIKVLESKVK